MNPSLATRRSIAPWWRDRRKKRLSSSRHSRGRRWMGHWGAAACRGLLLEFLAGHAVPAPLAPLDHIAGGFDPGEELLDDRAMARVGGADEAVVADAPAAPEVPVLAADGVAVGLGGEPGSLGRALDLETVFVAAGDEGDPFTVQTAEPGDAVAGERGVSAAQVGPVVDVIEGGGEGIGHQGSTSAGTTGGGKVSPRRRWALARGPDPSRGPASAPSDPFPRSGMGCWPRPRPPFPRCPRAPIAAQRCWCGEAAAVASPLPSRLPGPAPTPCFSPPAPGWGEWSAPPGSALPTAMN